MHLQSFVAETLSSIIEGVRQAQERYPGGPGSAAINQVLQPCGAPDSHVEATQVSFEIAVTSAAEDDSTGTRRAGLNVKVIDASLGSSKSSRNRSEAVNRVAFSVPLFLPVADRPRPHQAGPGPLEIFEVQILAPAFPCAARAHSVEVFNL